MRPIDGIIGPAIHTSNWYMERSYSFCSLQSCRALKKVALFARLFEPCRRQYPGGRCRGCQAFLKIQTRDGQTEKGAGAEDACLARWESLTSRCFCSTDGNVNSCQLLSRRVATCFCSIVWLCVGELFFLSLSLAFFSVSRYQPPPHSAQ